MDKLKKRMLKDWIGIGLSELSECSSSLEGSIEMDRKRLSEWIDKRSENLTEEQKEQLVEFYLDDYSKITDVIPNIFRSSLFVSYYSFLESTLLTICRHLINDNNYKLDPDDLRDTGIFKAQTYLKKVAGIKFPDNISSWNNIIYYNRIRNHIVHDQRRIPKSSVEKIKPFVKKNKWLKIDSMNRISFPKDFSTEVTKTLKEFFAKVIEALP